MKVQVLGARLAFPNLFEAKQVNGQGDAKFSASGILARDNSSLAKISEAITTVAKEKWGAKADEVLAQLKAAGRLPVHDGDAKANYEGYKGNLYLNASSKTRPLAIAGDRSALTASDGKLYSGCYVNMLVSFWAQDNQFGKRVNASLLGVQFVKDGERLAGGESASADDFEALVPPQEQGAVAKAGAAGLF